MEERDYLNEQATEINRIYKNQLLQEPFASHFYSEKTRYRAEGPFQRDFSRIMYSSSFRRLQGKMQLLGIREDQFFRNRLTHSLEVSQIARSIAFELKYDISEIYVVEAGALAHDLGNPPFGHSGETKLNRIFSEIGGFEGNAQTLRILTNIEKKKPDFRGLNLTYRTLFSVVKYNKKFDKAKRDEKQKFIYDEDFDFLNEFLAKNDYKVRTLDVQIVDLADEIAYAAHDLEDGLRLKCFTIDEILHDFYSAYAEKDLKSYEKLKEIVDACRDSRDYANIDSSDYTKLFRQELTSSLINLLIHDIGLIEVDQEFINATGTMWPRELGFVNYSNLAEGLKKITFKCINHNDEVYHYEQQGNEIIDFLVDTYRKNRMYLPPEYRASYVIKEMEERQREKLINEEQLQERLICDYIAGMMDSYAITTYKKFTKKES
ncbi:dGTPase [Anaerocolumna jejuensis DSM 15929]|uniref:dGTPase n=1 Tax=Anaerocolumna jejuensis DSM 15929 TaxID=1121322 RepID=A0A1M6UIQ3_9FIRM|nr:dNTP triphosphohydrolase [Anaerocolumna jejuensis]SHK69124.1 dGTPase [Anaerocolumna jejuensis DSM 15929]